MKKSFVLYAVGFVLLIAGGFMSLHGAPKADQAATAQCRAKLTAEGADAALVDQCSQKAFAIQMTATSAEAAAKGISAANNSEIGGNGLGMFLLGLGIALLAGGWMVSRKESSIA